MRDLPASRSRRDFSPNYSRNSLGQETKHSLLLHLDQGDSTHDAIKNTDDKCSNSATDLVNTVNETEVKRYRGAITDGEGNQSKSSQSAVSFR